MEWKFKESLIGNLNHLLELQKIYWKQKSNIIWVKDGDVGTKLFHANATLEYRNNLIAQLQKDNGILVHNHAEKGNIVWEAMAFNLSYFLQSNTDLSWLEGSFTREEVDNVVRNLPNDKDPGLDEFNNKFINKC
jgi:hypothetical protein